MGITTILGNMEKMDIFVSWSGPRSRAVAEAFKEYLPMIVNAFTPWLSSADIDKGARWNSDLATALATAKAGIICLTPNNLAAPYILFESGALSKTVDKAYVCTLLIGMEPSDVSGPLAQFQATKPTKDDLRQLMKTLNKALGASALKDSQVEATFDLCWPKLKERLDNLPADGPTGRPHRSERELLEELVNTVRSSGAETEDRMAVLQRELGEMMYLLSVKIGEIHGYVSEPFHIPGTPQLTPADKITLAELFDLRKEATALSTKRRKSFQHASRNALRDRLLNVKPEDKSGGKP
jgi:TIR domain-containing protein